MKKTINWHKFSEEMPSKEIIDEYCWFCIASKGRIPVIGTLALTDSGSYKFETNLLGHNETLIFGKDCIDGLIAWIPAKELY